MAKATGSSLLQTMEKEIGGKTMEVTKREIISVVVDREDSTKTYEGDDIDYIAAKIASDDEELLGTLWKVLNFSSDMDPVQFDKIINRDFVSFMDEIENIVEDWKKLNKKIASNINKSLK